MSKFKVSAADAGVRTDVFIAKKYPDFTRSSLETLFENNRVIIGNKPLRPAYKVKPGDVVLVDDQLIKSKPPIIEIPIIYEDDDVIVLNKPEGTLSHSKGAINNEGTVASFIKPKLDKQLTGNRAGIVHRLDRATSGVMIAAKNQDSLIWLQKQFSSRKTKKSYLAVIEGVLDPKEAIIDAPIARNSKKPQTFIVTSSGKPSQTHYKLIKQFDRSGSPYSLLELKPHTGRTHQLRVHLKYLNHPIIGDHVYGIAGDHLLLHASSLELTLPNRQRKVFTVEPPAYFKEFIGL